jgi:hypothetical protein
MKPPDLQHIKMLLFSRGMIRFFLIKMAASISQPLKAVLPGLHTGYTDDEVVWDQT